MLIDNHAAVRRDLLKLVLAGAAASALPSLASAAKATGTAKPTSAADRELDALMADVADQMLRLLPSTATSLGVDTGARSSLKARLEEVSHADEKQWAELVRAMSGRLENIDRKALGEGGQIRYDTLRYAAGNGIEGLAFSFGGAASGLQGGTAPFPVTQQDGAITRVPEFLDSQHQIATAADAEAYVARVDALARLLDQETARIEEQAAQGVMPPDFIMRTALGQLRDYRKTPAAEQKLVTSIAARTRKAGIAGDWDARTVKLVESAVYPALDRQIAAYAKAAEKASRACTACRMGKPITAGR
jgi:uncharacterized protein (DUF885 family)